MIPSSRRHVLNPNYSPTTTPIHSVRAIKKYHNLEMRVCKVIVHFPFPAYINWTSAFLSHDRLLTKPVINVLSFPGILTCPKYQFECRYPCAKVKFWLDPENVRPDFEWQVFERCHIGSCLFFRSVHCSFLQDQFYRRRFTQTVQLRFKLTQSQLLDDICWPQTILRRPSSSWYIRFVQSKNIRTL